jgi:hypothetical protein
MRPIDLSRPPPPNPTWLGEFMDCIVGMEPRVRGPVAIEMALGAHRVCWLLEPSEAAGLWLDAVRHRGWIPTQLNDLK